jgi:hypothetical protein
VPLKNINCVNIVGVKTLGNYLAMTMTSYIDTHISDGAMIALILITTARILKLFMIGKAEYE